MRRAFVQRLDSAGRSVPQDDPRLSAQKRLPKVPKGRGQAWEGLKEAARAVEGEQPTRRQRAAARLNAGQAGLASPGSPEGEEAAQSLRARVEQEAAPPEEQEGT